MGLMSVGELDPETKTKELRGFPRWGARVCGGIGRNSCKSKEFGLAAGNALWGAAVFLIYAVLGVAVVFFITGMLLGNK